MTKKITVSLPDEAVEAAHRAVAAGRAASVSAYVADVIARANEDEELAELLADMASEGGEPTEEHFLWARRALGLDPLDR